LNENHAVLMMGGKCVILNETIDPIFNRPDINFSSTQDFRTCYQNRKIEVMRNKKLTPVSIADLWLDSPERRQYKGIVFDPSRKNIPGYYNLYRGFALQPKQGSWKLMENHIYHIICSGDDECFRYLIAWMARIVQDPGGKRPGVVIVLRGKQGTGKGCFVTNFGAIFGSHFLHIISYTLVAGRFNSHFKDALLVFVDEGFWGGDKQAEGALKGMITEDYILIEAKHKDAFNVKNNTNFIFASNNDWVVPAAMEERRFFIMDVSEKHMNDSKYFEPIYAEMANGGREALLYDLLHYNIDNFDLRKFPRRDALLDQIIQSMSPVKKFWYEQLRHGGIISTSDRLKDYSTTDWPDAYRCDKLYELYLDFASAIGERYKPIDTQFGKQIRQVCPKINRKKRFGDWHYFLPTLAECREYFESLVKIKIEWDADENQSELGD
jgi:phage/plasmid-associated DNA primase